MERGGFIEFGWRDCVANEKLTNEIFEIKIRILNYDMCAGNVA